MMQNKISDWWSRNGYGRLLRTTGGEYYVPLRTRLYLWFIWWLTGWLEIADGVLWVISLGFITRQLSFWAMIRHSKVMCVYRIEKDQKEENQDEE